VIRLQACFLADRAIANPDGTFMIWRGGVNKSFSNIFPAPVQYALVLRLELDEESARDLHSVGIRILFNGVEIAPIQTAPVAVAPPPQGEQFSYFTMLANLQLVVASPGSGEIQVRVDEDIAGPRLPFIVAPYDPRQAPPIDTSN
jgi:hypothetical protein